MGGAIGDCNGVTQNVVRYDSPTFGGFSVSASWGEDDMWDVAARYAGEFNGFKFAAAAAYNEFSDENYNNLGAISACLTAMPTTSRSVPTSSTFRPASSSRCLRQMLMYDACDRRLKTPSTSRLVCVSVGPRWATPFSTVSTRQRGRRHCLRQDLTGSSDFDLWGLGVVQEIDAAAMSVWVSYRNIDSADDAAQSTGELSSDFQYIKAGALINF